MTLSPYERAGTAYTNIMKPFLAPEMIARSLFADVIRLPEGKVRMEFDKISQMKDATIQMTLPDSTLKRDMIGITSDSIRAPFIVNGFEIGQDQLRAFATEGKALPREGIKAMATTIAAKDQSLLIDSYKPDGTNVKFDGLYSKGTTIDNTAYDFSTPGRAAFGVATVVGTLRGANITGCNFNLLLPFAQETELNTSWIAGTGTGMWEKEKVLKNLNPTDGAAPGRIIASSVCPAGKAIISPVDTIGKYMSLIVGYDPKVITGYDSKLTEAYSPVYVTGFEAVVPLIYEPSAIGIMGSI